MTGQLGRTRCEHVMLVVESFRGGLTLRINGTKDGDPFAEEFDCKIDPKFWSNITSFEKGAPKTCGAPNWLQRPDTERRAAVETVAQEGRELFHLLFPKTENRKLFKDLIKGGKDGPPIVTVVHEGALIPWEAMHLSEEGDPLSYRDFLGWSHIILRLTNSYERVRKVKERLIKTVKVLEDDVLPAVGTGRAKNARERYLAASYSVLEGLGTNTYPDEIKKLHDFLYPDQEQIVDLIHFDCHVDIEKKTATKLSVRVTSEFLLPTVEFNKDKLLLGHVPFVFFNGCHGGTVGPGTVASLASYLRNSGAGVVLAGECEIGDDFTVTFAETFYSLAAKATNVGFAVLETRRCILGHDLNPLALFYGLYGTADMNIQVDNCLAPELGSPLAERLAWAEQAA